MPKKGDNGVIDPQSILCAKTELDLGYVPPTQTTIEKGWMVEYRPVASIAGQSTPNIEFHIPASMDHYLDLDEMFLQVKLKIEGFSDSDKTRKQDPYAAPVTTATPEVVAFAPVNNLLHSLFEKVELTLRNKVVTSNTHYYPHRAYFEKLLGSTLWAKNTYLSVTGWDSDDDPTKVSKQRAKQLLATGGDVDLFDRLHIDLCHQSKLLISGVNLKLQLSANKPEFYIHADTAKVQGIKVSFQSASLFVRHVQVSDFTEKSHALYLERNLAKYPIARNEIRQYVIQSGNSVVSLDNVINGQLPKRITLFMVDNDAENGTLGTNPFNFKHNNINYLAAVVDGEQKPSIAYTPNFTSGSVSREFHDLFRGFKQYPRNLMDLTYSKFQNGFTMFCFNLSPDTADGSVPHVDLIKRGNLRIDMRFSTAPAKVISVLLFCEYDNMIYIDKDREVTTDYC